MLGELADRNVPGTWVYGDRDGFTPEAFVREMHAVAGHGQALEIREGQGHRVDGKNRENLAQLARRALGRIGVAGPAPERN